ncbi:MAG: SRPBCC family protein [Verrucomicrobiota bacterium]
MDDSIEKTLELKAPVARVWRALTDHEEFGQWFRVRIDRPFVVGELSTGQITHPGCDHMIWKVRVNAMEHERLFSYSWCPLAEGSDYDFESEPKTLVEFTLEPADGGTRLVIRESGFRALPNGAPRIDALRRNTEGWTGQCENISTHVQG